jgi:putative DNA methylase
VSDYPIKSPRKLIEVALPLDAVNVAARDEKAVPRRGHPQTLHYWWARRPLAAARAVIFAQLVNDPGYQQGGGFKYGKNKKEAAIERKRLFKIIEDLVLWENTTNEEVLERARAEIRRSWREVCELNKDHPQAAELFNPAKLPALHDPFAGGGAIPLEAQRLGLEAYASDLNPVAVLINKAMIEIPPMFAGRPPVSHLQNRQGENRKELELDGEWPGATGLAEDVRHYGAWMREEAKKRIGNLYPPIDVTALMAESQAELQPLVGQKLTVLAFFWARTVKSPNPAFSHVQVPLASTFILSGKDGNLAYVKPVVLGDQYHFTVRKGVPPAEAAEGTKAAGRGANFRCVVSGSPISPEHIRSEAKAGRMGAKLMAVLAEGAQGRVCVSPTREMEVLARKAEPTWKPEVEFFQQALGFRVGNYGMTRWSDLFTPRQLVALNTFSDLLAEARARVVADALAANLPDDSTSLATGGIGTTAYSEAVSIYLGCALSRLATYANTICHWNIKGGSVGQIFARQAISMSWDYMEVNPLEKMSGNWSGGIEWVSDVLSEFKAAMVMGSAQQLDASKQELSIGKVVSTDPPYYDNIGYADLSDFFYVWLRPSLKAIYPDLFATLTVPKAEELVATPFRHGGKEQAEAFFLAGMTRAIHRLAEQAHPEPPITIYYAFKQSESDVNNITSSTGWETFLEAVNRAGLQLSGTWPMRTEKQGRSRANDSNALASSIILVCRKRAADAPSTSRREFIRELNGVLPEALDEMTKGSGDERSPVAPVDLSQAIIGPGMAVFSKYSAVLEADGSPMRVRTALQLINRFLAEDDFDADTQFCLHWFEQHGWNEGIFGTADTLARGKGTSVDGIRDAGVIQSGSGKVRLLKWVEYPTDWDPRTDTRTPVWEALHQLIRALKQGGESASGAFLGALGGKVEAVRQLAYRLYTLCERLGNAEDARAYNELITSWTGIESAAASAPQSGPSQGTLFEQSEQ